MSDRQERKDEAFIRMSELLAMVEAGELKIPAFAYVAYPELAKLREKAKEARKAMNNWLEV
jgi:hypothetical protein